MKGSSVATATASGGVTGAAVVIITWLLSVFHLPVPAEVAAAMMVVLTPILHLVALRMGLSPTLDLAPYEVQPAPPAQSSAAPPPPLFPAPPAPPPAAG